MTAHRFYRDPTGWLANRSSEEDRVHHGSENGVFNKRQAKPDPGQFTETRLQALPRRIASGFARDSGTTGFVGYSVLWSRIGRLRD
jgi:hypothetical protein